MAEPNLNRNQSGEAANTSATAVTALLQESTCNTNSFSPLTPYPRDSDTPSSENVAHPDATKASSGIAISDQVSAEEPKTRARYTKEQKAFVLHSSRNCKWAKVVSNFRELFPDRSISEAGVKELRKRLRQDNEEQYLLNKATTYPWYSLVLPDRHQQSEQSVIPDDYSEEEKSFLFYHYSVGNLQPLRIVEIFNEQFSRATTFPGLGNLITSLGLQGKFLSQRDEWLKIAEGSQWYKKYLPEPRKQQKKARPSTDGDKDATAVDSMTALRLKSSNRTNRSRSQSMTGLPSDSSALPHRSLGWPLEQQAYLAWRGLRVNTVEPVVAEFQAQFPGARHDRAVRSYLRMLRRTPQSIRSLREHATEYGWYERDLLPGEPGYPSQERMNRLIAARQKVHDKANERFNLGRAFNTEGSTAKAPEASAAGSNIDSRLMPPPPPRPRDTKTRKRVHWQSLETSDVGLSSHEGSHKVPKFTTNDDQDPDPTSVHTERDKRQSSDGILKTSSLGEAGDSSPNQRPTKKQRMERREFDPSICSTINGWVYLRPAYYVEATEAVQDSQSIASNDEYDALLDASTLGDQDSPSNSMQRSLMYLNQEYGEDAQHCRQRWPSHADHPQREPAWEQPHR